jgi:hypothetical protein
MNTYSKLMIPAMVAVMAGCGPARVVHESQKDSVSIIIKDTTIFRDSIIYVKVEAEQQVAVLPDTDTSYLATRYAESEAYVSKGQLYHSLRNKSEALLPIETKIPITIHFESRSSIKNRHAVEVVEVEKQLSKWQRFIQMLGYGALGFAIGWLIRLLAKFLR